jgi:type II secretory pathway pseudopilin PulG
MTLTRNDFRKLALPLAAMLALLSVAGLLAWSTQSDARKAEQERNAASAARTQVEQRLRLARNEEQEIKERARLLQRLQSAGIADEERRLDWMELLRDTQRQLRLPGMKYEFGVQTAADGGKIAADGWYASPLRIQFRLLHEGDLLNFLSRVQKDASALVIVRGCKLAPLPSQADTRIAPAQLGAECEMQWLTAHRPPGKG